MYTNLPSSWKQFLVLVTTLIICTGCSSFTVSIPEIPGMTSKSATVKIKSVPLKIAMAAGSAALRVAVEEFANVKIDTNELVRQVTVDDMGMGTPPNDVPVLMVVNKETNDILYWKLTKKVKMIRLRHDRPNSIELKVINDTPLRIELWIEGEIEEIDVTVEMRD